MESSDEEKSEDSPRRRASTALLGVASRIIENTGVAQAESDDEEYDAFEAAKERARKQSFLPAWLLDSRASLDASAAQHTELTANLVVLNNGIETLNVMKDKAEKHFSDRLKAQRDAKAKNAMLKAGEMRGDPVVLTAANHFFAALPLEVAAKVIAFGTVADGLRFGQAALSVQSAIVADDVWIEHVPIEIYGNLDNGAGSWRAVAVQLGKQNSHCGLMLSMLAQQGRVAAGHRERRGSDGSTGRVKPKWEHALEAWFRRAASKRQLDGKGMMTMDTQKRLFVTQGLGMMVNMTSHARDHRATRALLKAGACNTLLALIRDDDSGQTLRELACAALANLACDTEGGDITLPGGSHADEEGEEGKRVSELNGRRQLEVLSVNMAVRKLLCSPSMAPRGHNPSPLTQGLASKHAARLLLNLYSKDQVRLGLQYCTGNPLFDEILDAEKPSMVLGSSSSSSGGSSSSSSSSSSGGGGVGGDTALKQALLSFGGSGGGATIQVKRPLLSFGQIREEESEDEDLLELSTASMPVQLTPRMVPPSPRSSSAPSSPTKAGGAASAITTGDAEDGRPSGPVTEAKLLFEPQFYFSNGGRRQYGMTTWIRFEPKQSEAVPGQLRGGGEDDDGRFQVSASVESLAVSICRFKL
jgi:hypothetical protein